MSTDTRKGGLLGGLIVVALVVGGLTVVTGRDPVGLLRGIPDAVRFILPDKDNDDKEEICVEATMLPTARVRITWRIGPYDGGFKRREREWSECRTVAPGSTAYLLVEKTIAGNVACSIFLMRPGDVPRALASKAYGGTKSCEVTAVVP